MNRRFRRRCYALLFLASCGGGAMQTPATPASAPAEAPPQAPPPGVQPTAPAPAAGGAAQMSPESAVETSGTLHAQVKQAEAELEAAGNDCTAACRALASMERATDRLCGLADNADDRRRCEDARARLLAARNKVRNACGECR